LRFNSEAPGAFSPLSTLRYWGIDAASIDAAA